MAGNGGLTGSGPATAEPRHPRHQTVPVVPTPRPLDEIAEEAGYTTGAVYSNLKGKDDLFLAVLDAEAQRRFPLHTELMHHAGSIEEGCRPAPGRWPSTPTSIRSPGSGAGS